MPTSKTNTVLIIVVVFTTLLSLSRSQSGDSSFDSLVASQCRARCLSLHPWEDNQPISSSYLALKYIHKRVSDNY